MLSIKPETNQQQQPAGLLALEQLFDALNAEGVRYCHWKSNLRLEASLRGKTDLDLLIDADQKDVFEQMLGERDIFRFQPAPGRSYPSIENYLGYDPTRGKIFHLHVHYQLVLGEQFVKNYHLPLEEAFLDSVQLRYGVKTPVPELEIIILSLRALLKYRDRDALKDILSVRSPGLPHHIREEIEWLCGQTSPERISLMLSKLPKVVPADLVLEFLSCVTRSPRDGRKLLALRQAVRKALQAHQYRDRSAAVLKYFRELWRRGSFLNKRPTSKRMTLSQGGIRVAFVGADGAGKSTLIRELTQWLNWRLDVSTFYMGSSQPLRLTRLVKTLSKLAQQVSTGTQAVVGKQSPIARLVSSASILMTNLRYLCEAHDRYHRYQASCLEARRGALVLYDRYPLQAIQIFNRPMDGPRIASQNGVSMGWITRKLSTAEQELYQKIQPPDHIVMLKVRPEVSQARKPEHKWDLIVAKSEALQRMNKNGYHLTEVDAGLPLSEVLQQVKPVIWSLFE